MTSAKDERYNIFGSNGGTRLSAEVRAIRLVAVTCVNRRYGFRRFRLKKSGLPFRTSLYRPILSNRKITLAPDRTVKNIITSP